MKDGNILLMSLMLSEATENHLSFILCFLKTKSVNKPACGNLSCDCSCVTTFRSSGEVGVPHLSISLRITESFIFAIRGCDEEKKGWGPNSRKTWLILLKAPVQVHWSPTNWLETCRFQ